MKKNVLNVFTGEFDVVDTQNIEEVLAVTTSEPDGIYAISITGGVATLAAATGQAVGSIQQYASITGIPTNELILTGTPLALQEIDRVTYAALYAVIGDVFGVPLIGTNFILPPIVGLLPKGGTSLDYFVNGGSDTLTVPQLPQHTHSLFVNSDTADSGSGAGTYLSSQEGSSGAALMSSTPTNLEIANASSIGLSGSGLPHEHPYQNFIYTICFESVAYGGVSPTPNLQQVSDVGNNSTVKLQFNGNNYITTADFLNGEGTTWNPLTPAYDLGGIINNDGVGIAQVAGNFSWNFYINQVFSLEQHTHQTQVGTGANFAQLQLLADDIGSGSTSSELNATSLNNVSRIQLNADKGNINPTTNIFAANGGDYTELIIDKQKGTFGGANVAGVIGLQYQNDYAANNLINPRWIPDKDYVDNAINTAGTLQAVTDNGNFTTNEMFIVNGGFQRVATIKNSSDSGDITVQNNTTNKIAQLQPTFLAFYDSVANIQIQPVALTVSRIQTLQDADGIIALLGDIPTSEQIQDAAFAILTDTATVDLNYDDALNTVTATVIDNSITNAKLAQMPALTVIGNEFTTTQNAQYIPLKDVMLGTSFLQLGTRTITDTRISPTSIVFVSVTNVGIITGVPIRVTKNIGSVVFNTGQVGDTSEFDYEIYF